MKKILTFLLCLGFVFAFAACGKDNGSGSESSGTETSFYTVTAGYDYGSHIKGKPYMLYDDSRLFFDLPEDHGEVVAGDTFTIEYTGELQINYTYPSEIYVLNGEIVSVTAQKAETVCLIRRISETPAEVGEEPEVVYCTYNGGVIGDEVKIADKPQYYLTNDNGEIGCAELPYNDIVLYGTYSAVDGYSETDGYRLSGLYAWNVRAE